MSEIAYMVAVTFTNAELAEAWLREAVFRRHKEVPEVTSCGIPLTSALSPS